MASFVGTKPPSKKLTKLRLNWSLLQQAELVLSGWIGKETGRGSFHSRKVQDV